jgi:hypothetical protein
MSAYVLHVYLTLFSVQVGLPVASKNADTWAIKKPFLGMPGLKASPSQIQETKEFMKAILRLRYSSPLFRLPTAKAVMDQVTHASHAFPLEICMHAFTSFIRRNWASASIVSV